MAWRGDRQRSALFVSTPRYTVLDPADWIQAFRCNPSTVDSVHVTTLRTEVPLTFACDLLVDGNAPLARSLARNHSDLLLYITSTPWQCQVRT